MTNDRTTTSVRRAERGSVLPVCMALAAGLGAMLTVLLGRTVVEQQRVLQEASLERSAWRAIGQIEFAKNVIQCGSVSHGRNDVIARAIASDPPLIEGTPVVVERAGPDRWYRLSAVAEFGTTHSLAQCLLRDGLSYAAYSYYVESQGLALSGGARGRIHTNDRLEFAAPGGVYENCVSATGGFEFKHDASADNTTFLRGSDSAAAPKSLVADVSLPELKTQACYVAPAGLVADVTLEGKEVEIALSEAVTVVQIPIQKTRTVQIGTELKRVAKKRSHTEWRWIEETRTREVWVDETGDVHAASLPGGKEDDEHEGKEKESGDRDDKKKGDCDQGEPEKEGKSSDKKGEKKDDDKKGDAKSDGSCKAQSVSGKDSKSSGKDDQKKIESKIDGVKKDDSKSGSKAGGDPSKNDKSDSKKSEEKHDDGKKEESKPDTDKGKAEKGDSKDGKSDADHDADKNAHGKDDDKEGKEHDEKEGGEKKKGDKDDQDKGSKDDGQDGNGGNSHDDDHEHASGYWKTETYKEMVFEEIELPDETYFDEEAVPVYRTETWTDYVEQRTGGERVATVRRPAAGVFYFDGGVQTVKGDLNGSVTLVANSSVDITGNVRYVDDEGDRACLHGTAPNAGDFELNPDFAGRRTLAIIATGDIHYALEKLPDAAEIDANLVSIGGAVGVDGVVTDVNGNAALVGAPRLKASLRRLGSVIARRRPLAALLDDSGHVVHGFQSGAAIYDRRVLDDPPPGLPNEPLVTFLETVRLDPGSWTSPGQRNYASGVMPIAPLKTFDTLRDLTTRRRFDWGIEDLKSSLASTATRTIAR